MSRSRRSPLLLVVAVVLVATGVVTSLRHVANPTTLPSGLTVSLDAESTALYCTGLSSGPGAPGRVTFYNTSDASRSLSISVVSQVGNTYASTIELAAHASQSIQPSVLDTGENYGVAVQISGGGVVGSETAGNNHAEVPCQSGGVHHWYGTGFDTLVGSSAYVSVYNPTGTAAVLNATIYTAAGFSAPQSFQGVSIPAHTQTQINLGGQVVNTTNVGVGIDVLRGSLVIVGVQDSHGEVSFDQGTTSPSNAAWFPNVTTVNHATAQIRLANPNATPAQVTVNVALGTYHVAPQSVTVSPYSTSFVNITPNSAIPAAGFASLSLHANGPVVATLATGQGTWTALSAAEPPGTVFLVRDFTGRGFSDATITNTSSHTLSVTVTTIKDKATTTLSNAGVKVDPDTTVSLLGLAPTMAQTQSETFIISSPEPSLVVGMTLPSTPKGVNVVLPLNGG